MPYKLRKAPNKNLYWVVNKDSGKKHSIDPIPLDRANKQMRLLRAIDHGFIPSKNYKKKSLQGGLQESSCVFYSGQFSQPDYKYRVLNFIELCKNFPDLAGNNHTLDECLAYTGALYFFNCNNANDINNLQFVEEDQLLLGEEPVGYTFDGDTGQKLFLIY